MSKLIENIHALLELDAKGALVPHGIGGMARELFEKCKVELNTRAVPDVPELVRYRMDVDIDILHPIVEPDGEYVIYDQAAAVIAALKSKLYDMRVDRDRSLEWRDHDKKRAEAAEAKNIELEAAWLNAEGKISDLEAKLAQYEAQEPVGQNCIISVQKHLSDAGYKIPLKHIDDATAKHYASPAPAADLKAENERLREALTRLYRNGQKQGWMGEYGGYDADMQKAAELIAPGETRTSLNVETSHDKG